ncbi:MAG: hypothetical protein JKX99_01750 [Robiginitomaculum sp.]|nr:hypothetical protein [Robiginitomaculum sp.]
MENGIQLTEEQKKARNQRSIAIGLGLLAFVVVVFVVTVIRKIQEQGLDVSG